MTISTKQTAAFITAKPLRLGDHHRSYQENAKVTNPNPFARRPGGWPKPLLRRKLGRLGDGPPQKKRKYTKRTHFHDHRAVRVRGRRGRLPPTGYVTLRLLSG